MEDDGLSICFEQVHCLPGWIYDDEKLEFSSKTNKDHLNTEQTPISWSSFNHNRLLNLLDNDNSPEDYEWQKEFKDFEPKSSFLVRFQKENYKFLLNTEKLVKGTITKVKCQKTVDLLLLSKTNCKFYDAEEIMTTIKESLDNNNETLPTSCTGADVTCYIFTNKESHKYSCFKHGLVELVRTAQEDLDCTCFWYSNGTGYGSPISQKSRSTKESRIAGQNVSLCGEEINDQNIPRSIKKSAETYNFNVKSDPLNPDALQFSRDQSNQNFDDILYINNNSNIENIQKIEVNTPKSNKMVKINKEIHNCSSSKYEVEDQKRSLKKYMPGTDYSDPRTFSKRNSDSYPEQANKKHHDSESSSKLVLKNKEDTIINIDSFTNQQQLNNEKDFSKEMPTNGQDLFINNQPSTQSIPNSNDHGKQVFESNDLDNVYQCTQQLQYEKDLSKEIPSNGKDLVVIDQLSTQCISNPNEHGKPIIENNDQDNVRQCTLMYNGCDVPRFVSSVKGFQEVHIGCNDKSCKETGKVLLLLGATGSGKTALLNLVGNYYFGAQKADDDIMFIDCSHKKTELVTVYTFHKDGVDPVTVIDTPGLNDSTGAEIHDHVEALKSFLALACTRGLEIHAIGFVAQAHLVRLTSSERMVIDHVWSIFGRNIENHILTLVTFSDNQPKPPVVDAIEYYGIKDPFFVKFNNSLMTSGINQVDDLDRVYWRLGFKSWKKCIKHLMKIDSLPIEAILNVTNEVFGRSVVDKRVSNLNTELKKLMEMWKNQAHKISDQLTQQRNKVWILSNTVFNLGREKDIANKELHLLKYTKNFTCLDSAFLIFLMMDQESSWKTRIGSLVSSIHMAVNVLNYQRNVIANKARKSLIVECTQCEGIESLTQGYFKNKPTIVFKSTGKCKHNSVLKISPTACVDNSPQILFDSLKYRLMTMLKVNLQDIASTSTVKLSPKDILRAFVEYEPDYRRKEYYKLMEALKIKL